MYSLIPSVILQLSEVKQLFYISNERNVLVGKKC